MGDLRYFVFFGQRACLPLVLSVRLWEAHPNRSLSSRCVPPMAGTGSRTTPDRATHRYTIEHNDGSIGTHPCHPTSGCRSRARSATHAGLQTKTSDDQTREIPMGLSVVIAATALVAGTFGAAPHATQVTLFAAPTGAGTACTQSQPCGLVQAQQTVRTMTAQATGDIVVDLAGGTYRLTSPLRFGVQDSGLNGHKVVYQAAPRSEEHTSELQSRGHLVCRL